MGKGKNIVLRYCRLVCDHDENKAKIFFALFTLFRNFVAKIG